MYQRKGQSDSDSASLEGMEAVFDDRNTNTNYAKGDNGDQAAPEQVVSQLGARTEKRVLRGSYSKGLLILRESILPAEKGPTRQNGAGEPAISAFKAEKLDLTIDSFALNDPSSLVKVIGYAGSPNAVLLQLVRTYAEQAKTANELIKHLAEQLQGKDEYINSLLAGKEKPSLWAYLRAWMSKTR